MEQTYLANKVIFVTGSSRGIGKAIAFRAAELGALVVVHCRASRSEADEIVEKITVAGGQAALTQGDLCNSDDVIRCAEEAWNAFGKIDVLVNNAGINLKKNFIDTELVEMERLFNINVRGTYLLTRDMVRRMSRSDLENPRILTITSINGIRSGVGFSLYGGSKAWLEMMMKDLALEVASMGIRVNTFPVGAVKTDMTRFAWEEPELSRMVDAGIPLGRMAETWEVAELICAFAGPAGNYVTGSAITIDGGLSLTRSIGLMKEAK